MYMLLMLHLMYSDWIIEYIWESFTIGSPNEYWPFKSTYIIFTPFLFGDKTYLKKRKGKRQSADEV